ncbi:MAG: TIGR03936 family radical SAM-associated protein [Anaerolineae bacterium]|nr:TIGR03936 family radical SAM-associated protein [Anaerolineae bacterium]
MNHQLPETPNTNPQQPALRMRITFSTEKTLAFVSVLDLSSIWERSLRRAGIPLRYSQGFNPRPKMNFAAPLPVGCSAQEDLLDIWLESPYPPEEMRAALNGTTPPHLHVEHIAESAIDEPTLAEQLTSAEYTVWLNRIPKAACADRMKDLLTAETLPRPRRGRKYRGKTYDLRPLILDLSIVPESQDNGLAVWMHLKARPGATGRPDEVLEAMGIMDNLLRCSRTRLLLGDAESPRLTHQ